MNFFGQLTLAFKEQEQLLHKLFLWAEENEEILPLYNYNYIKNLKLFFGFLLLTVSYSLLLVQNDSQITLSL